MLYVAKLTVPKNTGDSAPVSIDMNPHEDVVQSAQVMFPTNAAGLVGVRILDRDSRFAPAPSSPTGWITGDGVTVEWDQDYTLSGPSHRVQVQAYNLDDTYPRTVEVRMEIVPRSMRQVLQALAEELRQARLAALVRRG
jgi:hypothetical protein